MLHIHSIKHDINIHTVCNTYVITTVTTVAVCISDTRPTHSISNHHHSLLGLSPTAVVARFGSWEGFST